MRDVKRLLFACFLFLGLLVTSCSLRSNKEQYKLLTVCDNNNYLVEVDVVDDSNIVDDYIIFDDINYKVCWETFNENKQFYIVNNQSSSNGRDYQLFAKINEETIKIDSLSEINDYSFVGACIDSNGYLYITNGIKIYIYDNDFSFVVDYESDRLITSIAANSSGLVIYSCIESIGDSSVYINSITNEGETIEIAMLDSVINTSFFTLLGNDNGFDTFFCAFDDSIYSLDINELECEKILCFSDNNIYDVEEKTISNDGDCFYVLGCLGEKFVNADVKYGRYKIKYTPIVNEREPINLAVCVEDDWLENIVKQFNSSNDNYYINVITGDDLISYDQADVIYGTMSDITNYDITDAYLDLNELSCFDDKMFLANVWESELDANGNRYWFAPFVNVLALYSEPEHSNEYVDYQHIIRSDNFENLYHTFIPFYLSNVYEEKEITNDDFVEFIEYVNCLSKLPYNEDLSVSAQLKLGYLQYINPTIGSYLQYLLLMEYFVECPIVSNYPYTSSPVFSSDYFFAVFDSCNVKNGVEVFFEYVLTDYNMTSNIDRNLWYFPITISAFEQNIEWILSLYSNNQIDDCEIVYSYLDGSEGGIGLPLLLFSEGDVQNESKEENDLYRNDGPSGRKKIVDVENYIEAYKNFVFSANGFVFYDYNLEIITNEEINSYISGDKDLNSVSGIIVDKITTCIEELN